MNVPDGLSLNHLELAGRTVNQWKHFDYHRKEDGFFCSLVETCLKAWAESEEGQNTEISANGSLPRAFCSRLLLREADVHDTLPVDNTQPGTTEGVLAYPLYRHIARSLHTWIKTGAFPIDMPEVHLVFRRVALELHVQEPYFSLLQDRRKTVEGRCNVGAYTSLKPGDLLLVNQTLLLQVEAVVQYSMFCAMLETEGLPLVLPGVDTIEEGVAVYRRFYSEQREAEGGVLAIRVGLAPHDLQQPEAHMRSILQCLGIDGIRLLLRLRQTVGSVPESLPPPPSALLLSFCTTHEASRCLSVGARALAKHSHRSSQCWWGKCSGSEAAMSSLALGVVQRILREAVWLNVHSLPHDLPVFEIRVKEGYGARWTMDGSQFRGFLEPQVEDGHERSWRH